MRTSVLEMPEVNVLRLDGFLNMLLLLDFQERVLY